MFKEALSNIWTLTALSQAIKEHHVTPFDLYAASGTHTDTQTHAQMWRVQRHAHTQSDAPHTGAIYTLTGAI